MQEEEGKKQEDQKKAMIPVGEVRSVLVWLLAADRRSLARRSLGVGSQPEDSQARGRRRRRGEAKDGSLEARENRALPAPAQLID